MIRKVLIISLVSLFLIYPNASAFQFEDYQWGKLWDEVVKKLETKGRKFSSSEYGLTYRDEILEKPCEVYLAFSSKSKGLAFISITWDTTSAGGELKKQFTQKYGKFYTVVEKMYFWLGPNNDITDSIYLNYTANETRLIYFGGKYYDKFIQEKINDTENK